MPVATAIPAEESRPRAMIRAPTLRRAVPSRGQARSVREPSGGCAHRPGEPSRPCRRRTSGRRLRTWNWGGAVGSRPCRRRRRRRTGEVLPPNSRRNANRAPCHGARTGGARAHLTAHAATLGVASRSLGAVPPCRRATILQARRTGAPGNDGPWRAACPRYQRRTLIHLTCDSVLCPAAVARRA